MFLRWRSCLFTHRKKKKKGRAVDHVGGGRVVRTSVSVSTTITTTTTPSYLCCLFCFLDLTFAAMTVALLVTTGAAILGLAAFRCPGRLKCVCVCVCVCVRKTSLVTWADHSLDSRLSRPPSQSSCVALSGQDGFGILSKERGGFGCSAGRENYKESKNQGQCVLGRALGGAWNAAEGGKMGKIHPNPHARKKKTSSSCGQNNNNNNTNPSHQHNDEEAL